MGEAENRDYLTGLYSRKGIYDKYSGLENGESIHVMFCDLDNFKSVNDIYGHANGDKLLIAIGEVLRECAPDAHIGRLGGDEFILILEGERKKEELVQIAESIIQNVCENKQQLQFMSMVSISIGVVRDEKAGEDFSTILHKSDAAMYQAKQRGKGCCVLYDDLESAILQENIMESTAEEALKSEHFRICYLPINNLQNSRLEQTEVIVHWEKGDGTFWSQEEFRPVLEKSGFIRAVDMYIFEKVCEAIPVLRPSEEQNIKMSVEISRLLVLEKGLGDSLKTIMDKYQIGMDEIELAISETAFDHRDRAQILNNMIVLKEMGFSLALIRFGENFSSFRYLRQLPTNTIRFDTNYIVDNMKNSRGRQIIKTLVRLGKDLKQTVVTDGITEQEEVMFLSSCGCDAAGGTYYSQLLTQEEYSVYAKERMKHRIQKVAYAFQNNLESQEGEFAGEIVGDGVRFIDGISNNWGALYFPGGNAGKNVVKFPEQLFPGDSYTIALWIKPDAVWSWGSVVYASYLGGFASLVPFAGEGISIFRIYEEGDLHGWHDILCRASSLHRWTFLTVTYDAFSESTRYYIDGKKAGYQVNVPIMYSCREVMLGGDPFQKSYTGSVSAFMVFDRAKTEEEIWELYESFLSEPGFRG